MTIIMQKSFINILVVKIFVITMIYMLRLFLLAVFANYRKNACESFGLDPLYCVSAPDFCSRAMLKMTNAEIKLITNIDVYLMIEKGISGGRCVNLYIITQKEIINTLTLILIKKKMKNHT